MMHLRFRQLPQDILAQASANQYFALKQGYSLTKLRTDQTILTKLGTERYLRRSKIY